MNRKDLAQYLAAGASGPNQFVERDTELAKQDKDAALKKYLQAQEPVVAGQKQTAQNESNLKTLEDPRLQDQVNNGGMAKVGDLTVGADPYAHMMGRQQNGDASARMAANKAYNSGLPKIQQVAQAASEGLDAVNDPQNIGSLGQARTLMLKAMGMNRYNEQEAKAVLPPTLYSYASNLFNQGGADNSPLNDVQRSNVNQFFKGQLDTAASQHKMLKQNAMNMYTSSPFASQAGMQAMSGMGAPIDDMFTQAASKYKQVPQTKGPDLSGQPQPGVLDKLKSFFGGGQSAPAAQTQQAPQANDPGYQRYQQLLQKAGAGQ